MRPGPDTWLGGVVTLRVPHQARAVQEARRCMRAALEAHALGDEVIDDSELVLAELLGNAVRHAKSLNMGTVEVSWRVRAGVVDLQVTDGGSRRVVEPRVPDPLSVGGRGLHIVACLARAWGVIDLRGGQRTIWASLVPGATGALIAAV